MTLLVLISTGIFCLLLTTTIILLTLTVAYCYYKGSTVDDVIVPPASTSTVVPPMAIALPHIVPKTAVVRNKRYRTPTTSMPTIPEETLQEILWAAAEVPARQQMRTPPVLLTGNSKTSDDSGDAYMILSGEPPSMPVIIEETEEDLIRENFRVTPLTGKYRPPAMPVILEETDEDLELGQEFSKVPVLVTAADTCDMPSEETCCELWARPLDVQQLPTVEQVRVCLVATTSSTSHMPTLCASNSAASPISSPILKITRGTYEGSSCTVVRCTAKMVVVQILGESQIRRIMKSSLSWV